MTIRVGIIGTGLIGEDHGRKLVNVINGATVSAVTDVNRARAEEVAASPRRRRGLRQRPSSSSTATTSTRSSSPRSARRTPSSCSPASRPASRSCARSRWRPPSPSASRSSRPRWRLGSGSSSSASCAATTPATGRSRRRSRAGPIGDALMLHNVHRNATVGEAYTSFMTMTDSMIHEVDTTRWLLGEEITAVQVIPPKRTPQGVPASPGPAVRGLHHGVRDPLDGRVLRQLPVRLRRPLRARRLAGHGVDGQSDPGVARSRPARWPRRVPADWRAALRGRLHRRAPGLDHRAAARRVRRSQRLGGLRGDQGRRGRRGGREDRRSGWTIDYIEKPALYRLGSHEVSRPARRPTRRHAEDRARPVHVPDDAPDGAAGAGRRPGLSVHRALAARGLHPVLPAPAGRHGRDPGVQAGPGRGGRRGLLAPAAVPLVRPRRGRAPGGRPLLEAVDRDRGRAGRRPS